MGARREVLQVVSGWQAVELLLKCLLFGAWQLAQMAVKRLWKGHRRKAPKTSAVEVTVDSSIGRHCYIKIMGVKYHYVETGPKTGQKVLVLCDAPETADLWGPSWCYVVKQLVDSNHHVVTLDLRGTGASEGGSRRDLSPPRAVEELTMLMSALGVSEHNPATVIGFGIGGMLTWYLAHCRERLVRRMAVVGAPHPNLYWQFPPASFCKGALYFIQWPHFPERWLADSEQRDADAARWGSSRARDWVGALHYVRGAAWWRVRAGALVAAPALLVGGAGGAGELVGSAQHCAQPTLRLVASAAPAPADPQLPAVLLDFLNRYTRSAVWQDTQVKSKKEAHREGLSTGLKNPSGKGKRLIILHIAVEVVPVAAAPRAGLVGRVLGAVAGRGRELTRLALPATA